MKPEGVTIQTKALNEYILIIMFILPPKRVHFLVFFLKTFCWKEKQI